MAFDGPRTSLTHFAPQSVSGLFQGAFGCNGKSAQTAVVANAALPTTGTTTTTPFGFTLATQGDQLVLLVNQIRATLVACGIMA